MSKYRIYLDGKVYEMRVEIADETTAPQHDMEEAVSAQVAESRPAARPSAETAEAGGAVRCPMPGTVISVLKQAGDAVKAGEVVVILEAMKMENEICARKDGTITRMNCAVQQTFSAGDVLFEIG